MEEVQIYTSINRTTRSMNTTNHDTTRYVRTSNPPTRGDVSAGGVRDGGVTHIHMRSQQGATLGLGTKESYVGVVIRRVLIKSYSTKTKVSRVY